MNKYVATALCLVLVVTLSGCRKRNKEERKQAEEISNMLEINEVVETENTDDTKTIAKF